MDQIKLARTGRLGPQTKSGHDASRPAKLVFFSYHAVCLPDGRAHDGSPLSKKRDDTRSLFGAPALNADVLGTSAVPQGTGNSTSTSLLGRTQRRVLLFAMLTLKLLGAARQGAGHLHSCKTSKLPGAEPSALLLRQCPLRCLFLAALVMLCECAAGFPWLQHAASTLGHFHMPGCFCCIKWLSSTSLRSGTVLGQCPDDVRPCTRHSETIPQISAQAAGREGCLC
jgi:hypothetical protein